jgi:pimeloyl-ACP methyl ester carboxylesterase
VYNGDGAIMTSLQRIGPTLTEAKCPLYVFSGDYDFSATPAMGKAAAERLGGRCIQMKGKGHFPMAEDPVDFQALLVLDCCRPKWAG